MWFECPTPQNVKSGFESTGIFPVDRSKYKRDRLNPRLLRRYSKWVEEGKKLNFMEMATYVDTPKQGYTKVLWPRGTPGLIFREAPILFCRLDFDVSIRAFFASDFASTYPGLKPTYLF